MLPVLCLYHLRDRRRTAKGQIPEFQTSGQTLDLKNGYVDPCPLGLFFGLKLSCGLLNHLIIPSRYVAKSAFRPPFQLNKLFNFPVLRTSEVVEFCKQRTGTRYSSRKYDRSQLRDWPTVVEHLPQTKCFPCIMILATSWRGGGLLSSHFLDGETET